MTQFNLDNYETVKERKQRFYADYPDGRLITEIVLLEKDHVVIKGIVYRNKEDQKDGCPCGVGHAEEFKGQGGFANKHAWTENCDESAIGRALDQAGYSGNGKCSKEEIQKVQREEKKAEQKPEQKNTAGFDFNVFVANLKKLKNAYEIQAYREEMLKVASPTQIKNAERLINDALKKIQPDSILDGGQQVELTKEENPFSDDDLPF